MKTTSKHALLEMILLQLCQGNGKKNKNENSPAGTPLMFQQEEPLLEAEDEEVIEDDEQEDDGSIEDSQGRHWQHFVQNIEALNDPLMSSIFKQGRVVQFDATSGKLTVAFAKKLSFFSDWLLETHAVWQPLLTARFGQNTTLDSHFTDQDSDANTTIASSVPAAQKVLPEPVAARPVNNYKNKPSLYTPRASHHITQPKEQRFDVSDVSRWPMANVLLRYFPGTITQVQEIRKHE